MAKEKSSKSRQTDKKPTPGKKQASSAPKSARKSKSGSPAPKKTTRKNAPTPVAGKKSTAAPKKKAASSAKTTKTSAGKQGSRKKSPATTATQAVSPATPVQSAERPVAHNVQSNPGSIEPGAREELRRLEEDPRELPLEYGETKVVLLTRDPEWIFAYWEMSPETRKDFGLPRGQHDKHLLLRVYDLAMGQPGQGAEFFDVSINDYTSSWYIRVPKAGTSYAVQLGVVEDDHFRSIATSNTLHIPRRGISEETDLQFAEIDDEVYQQIVHLSGGVRIGERLGSDEFLRSLQQRVSQALEEGPFGSAGLFSGQMYGISSGLLGGASGEFSGVFHEELSSGMLTGGAGEETLRSRAAAPGRDFWLEVGVDVIVYGATEPDAHVSFMGQQVRLTPDGTFRIRMVLPDSTVEFPIEARSASGGEVRKVKPVVTRQTEGDPRKPS